MRRMLSLCCACATSGQAAVPLTKLMKSRLLNAASEFGTTYRIGSNYALEEVVCGMSALSHKQTFAVQSACPLYPPEADILRLLFDHFVGADE
jgi:hypothetical protein